MDRPFHATQRLAELLSSAESSGPRQVGQFLVYYMGLDINNPAEWYQAYAMFIELSRNALKEAKAIDGPYRNLYVEPLEAIEKIVTRFNPGDSVGNLLGQIGAKVITQLPYCVHATANQAREIRIESDKISELIDAIQELRGRVISADLSEELKTFLVEQLFAMERAVSEYRIGGKDALQNGLAQIIGNILYTGRRIDPDLVPRKDDNPSPKQALFNLLWDLLAKMDTLVSLGTAGALYLPLLFNLLAANP
jgi:hypothetical protein